MNIWNVCVCVRLTLHGTIQMNDMCWISTDSSEKCLDKKSFYMHMATRTQIDRITDNNNSHKYNVRILIHEMFSYQKYLYIKCTIKKNKQSVFLVLINSIASSTIKRKPLLHSKKPPVSENINILFTKDL